MENGEILSFGCGAKSSENPIQFIDVETGKIIGVEGSHWVKIMELQDDGMIVSSWGKKCFVSYDDLIDNAHFYIISDKINFK